MAWWQPIVATMRLQETPRCPQSGSPRLDSGRSPLLTRSVALLVLVRSAACAAPSFPPRFACHLSVATCLFLLAAMCFSAVDKYYFKFLGDTHARLLYQVAGPRIRSRSVKP